jgi:hypothetical protein
MKERVRCASSLGSSFISSSISTFVIIIGWFMAGLFDCLIV